MSNVPTLRTPRLVLRPFVPSDAAAVQRLAAAREIAETTLTIPHPYPEGEAERWIASHAASVEKGEAIHFAIVIAESDELCGTIVLMLKPANERAELGYWIGVECWGRGYATEAATEILRYGFEELALHKIYALHFARNPASGKVLQKIGMQHEGRLREHQKKGSGFEDLEFYGLLRSDWAARVGVSPAAR